MNFIFQEKIQKQDSKLSEWESFDYCSLQE